MKKIGDVLKDLRLLKGVSLTEMAEKCNVSKGLISQIENNRVSPPLQTLARLLKALQMSLTDFFYIAESNEGEIVIKKNERILLDDPDGARVWKVAARDLQIGIEPRIMEVLPGRKYCSKIHKGKEYVYVISGSGDARVGQRAYSVQPGDSLVFSGMLPFEIDNKRDEIFKAVRILQVV